MLSGSDKSFGRTLPILQEDGEVLPDALSVIIGYRHYPDEPLSARIVAFAHAENARCPEQPSRVGDRIESDIIRKGTQAMVAGEVLLRWMQIEEHDGEGSLKRAVFLVSEESYVDESPAIRFEVRDGNDVTTNVRISSDPSDVRRAFRSFKNSSHLLAASALHKSEGNEERDLRSFCAIAYAIQEYAAHRLSIRGWDPWLVPAQFSDGKEFKPDDLSPKELEILSRYRT